MNEFSSDDFWAATEAASAEVSQLGDMHGLPYIAAQSDLGDPEPMCDANGQPYAETHFRWFNPDDHYWHNRRLALDSPFLNAARMIGEPFAYCGGRLHCWRASPILREFDCSKVTLEFGITGAIIAPIHLPRGQVGAVVWAGREDTDAKAVYEQYGFAMHSAALRLIGAHSEASARESIPPEAAHLTRREVQCVRWASKGKTDVEIGLILALSISTVRFHLRNAAAKFGTIGRTQTIRHAASLGFIGARSG